LIISSSLTLPTMPTADRSIFSPRGCTPSFESLLFLVRSCNALSPFVMWWTAHHRDLVMVGVTKRTFRDYGTGLILPSTMAQAQPFEPVWCRTAE